MARVDRQHRLIEAIEARAPRFVPAEVLATELEVSTRTVERDIAELGNAGVLIATRRGPGGGYAMAGPILPEPLRLERDELALMIAALVGLGDHASATARRALTKLIGAHHGTPAPRAPTATPAGGDLTASGSDHQRPAPQR